MPNPVMGTMMMTRPLVKMMIHRTRFRTLWTNHWTHRTQLHRLLGIAPGSKKLCGRLPRVLRLLLSVLHGLLRCMLRRPRRRLRRIPGRMLLGQAGPGPGPGPRGAGAGAGAGVVKLHGLLRRMMRSPRRRLGRMLRLGGLGRPRMLFGRGYALCGVLQGEDVLQGESC
jgi:hypothetical protein